MAKKKNESMIPLYTQWSQNGYPDNIPLNDYPRPQLRRDNWLCLNGRWNYAFSSSGSSPDKWDGNIIVPFSPESILSGVSRQLKPGESLWYSRQFNYNKPEAGKCALLHFGAVDQHCKVWCNGMLLGGHSGGYWPFSFDISSCLNEGENSLLVAVQDDSDRGDEAYGKQKLERGNIWYTGQSGIWQTVWLETLPQDYIESIAVKPEYNQGEVSVKIKGGSGSGIVRVIDSGITVAEEKLLNCKARLKMPADFKSWSPDSPFLYDLEIESGEDKIKSYFGMREFAFIKDKNGILRPSLNGKAIFHNGLLDQGYWSDGMMTPPSDDAMVWEIEKIKNMGFNMLRKHIKIEPLRWYYHCDRLGVLVWQDFVSGGGPYKDSVIRVAPWIGVNFSDNEKNYSLHGRKSEKGRDCFIRDAKRTVKLLYNCVSLAVWVPFNEGWGQFDAKSMCGLVKNMDSTRLIDHASGYFDQGAGDFQSYHIYYKRFKPKKDKYPGRILALTEFGGYSLPSPGHMVFNELYGYKFFQSKNDLHDAIDELYEMDVFKYIPAGLSAVVYTQLSDIESEINGLFSYDRRIVKVDEKRMKNLNTRLYKDFDSCIG